MKSMATKTMLAGLFAGFLGITLAHAAQADTVWMYRSVTTTPESTFVETPTIERVITSPVVIERPSITQRVIERPATIEQPLIIQEKASHHLLNLKLF